EPSVIDPRNIGNMLNLIHNISQVGSAYADGAHHTSRCRHSTQLLVIKTMPIAPGSAVRANDRLLRCFNDIPEPRLCKVCNVNNHAKSAHLPDHVPSKRSEASEGTRGVPTVCRGVPPVPG